MLLDKEAFINRIKERIGEGTSDDDISFLEDMTDTADSVFGQPNADLQAKVTELENKNKELDATWRARYKARFFSGETIPTEDKDAASQLDRAEEITINDLFSEVK